ncbi:hypothetical protein CFC21_105258 [Triticum aestivum]|uniref:Cytochrome P450 n=2 Tax=Triticum aestivum TaxID=4565 RepID=A0A3B6SNA5_WHEAT|nr:cytochrome P450 71A1-like [Triticum aestivum]KAF7104356.1 hypothetical protein CFC21_105258 [Triticum aestivum]
MPFPVPLATLQVATLILVVSCSLLLLLRNQTKKHPADQRLPPSPPRLPIVGNLHQLGALPHRALHALAVAHGPVMLLYLGRVPTLVVSSADAAREVLQLEDHAFANRPSLAIPRRLLYGCTDIAFAPHGAYWRSVRKLAVLHLLSPGRVRAYRGVRQEEVAKLVRRVEEERAHGGGVVRLSELLGGFAKDVNGRIVLGVRASGAAGWRAKVDALLEEANALLGAFHVGDYFPWLAWVAAVDGTDAKVSRAFERIDRILEEIVDVPATASTGVGGCRREDEAFVHVLLSLQRESSETGFRLSRDNVKALLEDLFGAGTDSTIIVLEWVMAELLRNKPVMQKLQQEIRRHYTKTSHLLMITEQDLPVMEYLRAVIKETMRLHPPGPLLVPRESMQHARVQDYHVPSGTRVIVNAWAVGRDPAAWEHVGEFWPERFINSKVDFRGQHSQLIPFGAGRRMCPGIGFTTTIVELTLANLVGHFDWAVPPLVVVDMEEAPGITSRKRVPIYAVAIVALHE